MSGTPVTEAALPLGRYDRDLLAHLRALGYTAVHTSDRRWAREGDWLQPRFSVRDGDTADSVRRAMLGQQSPDDAPSAHSSARSSAGADRVAVAVSPAAG